MLVLIMFLIVGATVVYISQYNFTPVTVNLGVYVLTDIPLFYVIAGSLLIGLVLSYMVSLIRVISNSITIRGKNKEIKSNKNEVLELTRRVHKLEIENKKLGEVTGQKPEDPNAL